MQGITTAFATIQVINIIVISALYVIAIRGTGTRSRIGGTEA